MCLTSGWLFELSPIDIEQLPKAKLSRESEWSIETTKLVRPKGFDINPVLSDNMLHIFYKKNLSQGAQVEEYEFADEN